MGVVKADTWKKLVEQAEIVEESTKKFELSVLKNSGEPTAKDVTQLNLPKAEGKEMLAVKVSGEAPSKPTWPQKTSCGKCFSMGHQKWALKVK